jgi:hypothetical protein
MSPFRTFFLSMAAFWLLFGLGTTFYPQMMQIFMTPEGVAASTAFSDQVWLHEVLDILSVCVLLSAFRMCCDMNRRCSCGHRRPVADHRRRYTGDDTVRTPCFVPGAGMAFTVWFRAGGRPGAVR